MKKKTLFDPTNKTIKRIAHFWNKKKGGIKSKQDKPTWWLKGLNGETYFIENFTICYSIVPTIPRTSGPRSGVWDPHQIFPTGAGGDYTEIIRKKRKLWSRKYCGVVFSSSFFFFETNLTTWKLQVIEGEGKRMWDKLG